MKSFFVSIAAVLLTGTAVFAAGGTVRTFEPRLFGPVRGARIADGSELICRDAETARLCASKYRADLLGFGDAKPVAGREDVIALPGGFFCRPEINGSRFRVRFHRSAADFDRGSSGWLPAPENAYPRWFDRFDNDAAGMGFFGWGVKPKDIYRDFAWTRQYFRRILHPFAGEVDYLAPGVYDFSMTDWWLAMAEKYDFLAENYPSHDHPGRPQFPWNVTPLPHIANQPYRAVHDGGRLPSAQFSEYTPIKATDPHQAAGQELFGSHVRNQSRYGAYFAAAEIGDLAVPFLTPIADAPETREAWRDYLRNTLKWSLAEVGKRHCNDPGRFRSWEEIPVPVMRDFSGWGPGKSRDLLSGNWEALIVPLQKQENAAGFRWFPARPNDPVFQAYNHNPYNRFRDKDKFGLKFRTSFTVAPGELPVLRFLHIEPVQWHRIRFSYLKVLLNGKELKNIARRTPSYHCDGDDCFNLTGFLKAGENRLEIETNTPLAGYVFASSDGVWRYPSPDRYRNRRYFDAAEFSAQLRADHLETVLKNFRRGDGNSGRPQLVMACNGLLDKLIPPMRRHGGFPHDTGMTGATFCPWTTAYGVPHRLPISVEPGFYPQTAAAFQRIVTLYLAIGADSVNFLFAPEQYRDADKGGNGCWLEAHRELVKCLGKLDLPENGVGVMRSVRNASRLGLSGPWNLDWSRGALPGVGRHGQVLDPSDLVEDRGGAYPVIIDAASELLTEAEIAGIERYVRRGGTFIATQLTGIHSPEEAENWPISRLTGLKVVRKGGISGSLRFSEKQRYWPDLRGKTVSGFGYAFDYTKADHSGDPLGMEPLRREVEIIARWEGIKPGEGRVAIAERRIGKGRILVLGSSFLFKGRDADGSWKFAEDAAGHLDSLLTVLGVPRQSRVEPYGRQVFADKRRSKNGLYDLYFVARLNAKNAASEKYRVAFSGPAPRQLCEISENGHPEIRFETTADGGFVLPELELAPMQCRIFASPAADLTGGPLNWIGALERRWGPLAPGVPDRIEPQKPSPWIMPLADGWQVLQHDPGETLDWNRAKPVRLGAFDTMGLDSSRHAVFRKTVVLPESWRNRRVELLFDSPWMFQVGVFPRANFLVNGRDTGMRFNEYEADQAVPVTVPPDRKLTLELRIDGKLPPGARRSRPVGVLGMFYLAANPRPEKSLEITQWTSFPELDAPVSVKPGESSAFRVMECRFRVPADWPRKNIFFELDYQFGMLGWLELNGRVVSHTLNEEAPYRQLLIDGLLAPPGEENVLRWAPFRPSFTLALNKLFRMKAPKARIAVWRDLPYAPGK